MIHGGSVIRFLNTTLKEHGSSTIQDLWQKYAHLSTEHEDNLQAIDLQNRNVYIQDETGWTKILAISRSVIDCNWAFIECANKQIKVTEDYMFPMFNEHDTKIGFQGNVLHRYELLAPNALSNNAHNKLKLYKGKGPDNYIIDFHEIDRISTIARNSEFGYLIYTESKFATINGVLTYASISGLDAKPSLRYR